MAELPSPAKITVTGEFGRIPLAAGARRPCESCEPSRAVARCRSTGLPPRSPLQVRWRRWSVLDRPSPATFQPPTGPPCHGDRPAHLPRLAASEPLPRRPEAVCPSCSVLKSRPGTPRVKRKLLRVLSAENILR